MLKTSDFVYVIHHAIVMRVNEVDNKRKEPKKKRSRMVPFSNCALREKIHASREI
jgi:hypothetical protein